MIRSKANELFPQLGPLRLHFAPRVSLGVGPAGGLLTLVARHGQLPLHAHKVLPRLGLTLVGVGQLLQRFSYETV